jgi:hypothetical protein
MLKANTCFPVIQIIPSCKYKDDVDYGQTYFDEVAYDNIFALAVRKRRFLSN